MMLGVDAQLANIAKQAKAVLQTDKLDAVADRGYFSSPEILACHEAGITVTLPKPMTSSAKADGRFGRQDFVYIAEEDVYRCPAGERLTYRYTNEEAGKVLRRYWTTACSKCPLKSECTTGPERRIAHGGSTSTCSTIDGSKFKAVNNRDKNFTRAKVERRRAQLEESVARYLCQLDTADRQEPSEALGGQGGPAQREARRALPPDGPTHDDTCRPLPREPPTTNPTRRGVSIGRARTRRQRRI